MLPPDYTNRFIAIWDTDAEHATAKLDRSTVQSRLSQWESAIQIAQHNPVFGVGLGNYAHAREEYSGRRSRQGAHNSYLSIAAESGILGLILFVSTFGAGLMLCNRTIRREGYRWLNPNSGMIRSSLAAYLVTSLFLTRPDMALAYLLLGWALAAATANHLFRSNQDAPTQATSSPKPNSNHRTIYDQNMFS
jgi:O-antigen ligase